VSDDSKRQDRSDVASAVTAIDRNNLEPAKELLNDLMRYPHLIHDPDLKFVKSFLLHFNCRDLPAETCGKILSSSENTTCDSEGESDEVECEEDDFLEERIDDKLQAPETIPPPPCGTSPDVSPSESDMERATQLKQEAAEATSNGDLNKAINCLSSALLLVPSALLYARRAEVLLLSRRPTAALTDCNRALELNPDSPKALKMRGLVQRAFGEWELALTDLKRGLAFDHDDAAAQTLRECEEALEGVAQRREARLQREKTRVQRRYASYHSKKNEDVTGPQMMTRDAMADIITDPDMVLAMKTPKVLEAMKDVMANPEAVFKYAQDPEISRVITKLMLANVKSQAIPDAIPDDSRRDSTCGTSTDMDAAY